MASIREGMSIRCRAAEAKVERLQRVVVAARASRAATGNYNLHRAECGQSCDICDGLADIELDAANELDMELAQAASAR